MKLGEAVRANDLEQLRTLLSDENFDRFELADALFSASHKNDTEAVELLIEASADVNCEFDTGTCLTKAIAEENIEIVKVLLKAGADVLVPEYKEVDPPLCEAAYTGNLDLVKLLFDAGADVNQFAKSTGDFALSIAAGKGYVEIYDHLTPLSDPQLVAEAAEILPFGIHARELAENADPLVVELSNAVFEQDLPRVIAVIKQGMNVNGLDEHGETALYVASFKDNLEIVKVLLAAGADPNLPGDRGDDPPLQWNSNGEAADLLINAGADVDWQDPDGVTSLMICAISCDKLAKLKVLLEANANLDIVDREGNNVLMYAVQHYSNLEKVKLLLEFGVDVNATNNEGDTPLKLARQRTSANVVRLIIQAGAK